MKRILRGWAERLAVLALAIITVFLWFFAELESLLGFRDDSGPITSTLISWGDSIDVFINGSEDL